MATSWALRANLRGPAGPPGLDGTGYQLLPIPAGSTTPTVTHELDTQAVQATVFDVSGGAWVAVPVAYQATADDQVQFGFAAAPTAGQYMVLLTAGAPVSAQLVPVPPVDLVDAATIASDAQLGVHFVLDAMGGPTRTLGAPSGPPVRGQRVLWELTAAAACVLTLAPGAGGFEPTEAAPELAYDLAVGQTLVLGGLWSPARDRWLLLAAAPTT